MVKTFLFFLVSFSGISQNYGTDNAQKMDLKGKVKTMINLVYRVKKINDSISKVVLTDSSFTNFREDGKLNYRKQFLFTEKEIKSQFEKCKYDNNGNEIKWETYKSNGELELYIKFYYDKQNNNICDTIINGDGSMRGIRQYEFNDLGLLVKKNHFVFNSKIIETLQYDSQKRIAFEIEERHGVFGETTTSSSYEYLEDGVTKTKSFSDTKYFSKTVEVYNAKSQLIERSTYTKEGKLKDRDKHSYDQNGFKIRSEFYDSELRLSGFLEHKYKYDEHNNFVEHKFDTYIQERIITYY